MIKSARSAALGLALAASAPTANAAQITASASANVAKPVSLIKLQDMDFGTLLVENYVGTRSVVMSRSGVIICPAQVTCSGAPKQARVNIQGTNRMVVLISVTSSGLSDGTNTIPFASDAPASITMANSGAPGTNVDIGGTLTVDGSIPGGVYSGTLTITANYQ